MAKNQIKYLKGSNQPKEQKGFFNYFFGSGNKSSRNIVGLICFIIILGIFGIIFFGGNDKIEILEKMIPVFTFVFGYFIGSRNQ